MIPLFRNFVCEHRHRPYSCLCKGDYCSHINCWNTTRYEAAIHKCAADIKIGYLDIEVDNLDADFGVVLSWCIKERDSNKIYSAIINRGDIELSLKKNKVLIDKRILVELSKVLNQFDFLICHYGAFERGLDIRFLRTRFLKHNLKFPVNKQIYAIDTYPIARNKLKLHSNRLETIAEFLDCPYKKTDIKPDTWIMAKHGSPKALRYLAEHNRNDVFILEWVHKRLEQHALVTKRSI